MILPPDLLLALFDSAQRIYRGRLRPLSREVIVTQEQADRFGLADRQLVEGYVVRILSRIVESDRRAFLFAAGWKADAFVPDRLTALNPQWDVIPPLSMAVALVADGVYRGNSTAVEHRSPFLFAARLVACRRATDHLEAVEDVVFSREEMWCSPMWSAVNLCAFVLATSVADICVRTVRCTHVVGDPVSLRED